MTKGKLPTFKKPPVIETALSAQFQKLPNYTNAVSGWFWKQCLSNDWTKTQVAPYLVDQFERFGDERKWAPFGSVPFSPGERIQIVREDDQRMIQLQDTRFILNWRNYKGEVGGYPTYDVLLPEFKEAFSKFREFAHEAKLGEIVLTQWEVTYVNHLAKGGLWNSPSDWPEIFPSLYFPPLRGEATSERIGAEWVYAMGRNRGRLYITLNCGKLDLAAPEALMLQFTARGPVSENVSLEDGFNLGREIIVKSFVEMTSAGAQAYWGRIT